MYSTETKASYILDNGTEKHAFGLCSILECVRFLKSSILIGLLAALSLSQDAVDPWPKSDLLEPSKLAQEILSSAPPTIICVAFPVLYRGRHILHAVAAGPGSKPEGLDALKQAVAGMPKNADIVIYCGCCPMVKCPNIRPAYRTLSELGFKHVRVLNIPTNMHDDWYAKNYPSEEGTPQK